MNGVARFQEHWLSIDPERLDRYETMFEWSTAAEAFYAPADIGSGQIVADFGCGPGHTAIELARRVGSCGHVHALDINAEFVRRTRARAQASGFADRVTAHLLDSDHLPLADATLDRMTTRNTIVYVGDPLATFKEFSRVLKPGGLAHVIEGDWHLTAVEPLGEQWKALVEAAMWAWPTPNIGRQLYGIARQAGFTNVTLQVTTAPDTEGRLLGMIRTIAGYARDSGSLDQARIDASLEAVERSVAAGTYLAIVPQFLVTATK